MSNYNEACPYCGGTWVKSPEHNGYEQWKCKNCGHTIVIKNDDDRLQMYEMGQCVDMMISFVHDRRAEKMSERIQEWEEWQIKFNIESYIKKYSGKLAEDPLFAMAQIARLTCGFQTYKVRNSESTTGTVKSLYKTASKYLKEHPDATKLAELIDLYDTKLRKKAVIKTRVIIGAIGVVAAALVTGFVVGMSLYSPSANDVQSGVNISIPSDSVSIFKKFNVNVDVEHQPQNSVAYIDAKNALRNEAEKFQLYDISLKSGENALNFDGSVTVTMPIPEGYDTSALKVYYVESDEVYEEMPSSVSVAQNTISFETTHFSLYALAERHPIVTFDSDGSTDVDRQIVKRDGLAQCPSAPQKLGYTFGGWALDGQKWNFDKDTVKKDITLVAMWTPNSYTLTLNSNGGSGAAESIKVTFMSPYGSLPTPIKSGYTFMGWYTSAEHGQKITSDTIVNNVGDHTVYAIFSINTNKIVFNPNGADGSMDDFSLNSGVTAKLPANSYTKVGYVFAGWSTTLTGDAVYSDQGEYTMGTEAVYTLYAQWTIRSGNVKFNANGGEGTMEPLALNYGQTQILPSNTFTRAGYKFIGWSITPNGSVEYENTAQYSMGENSEYTLYAQWQKALNMLYFNANGGVGSMDHLEMTYDSIQRLPYNEFTREGYNFIGWSTEPIGDVAYGDGVEYRMPENPEYTLYAQWEAKENKFTFYANNGKGTMPTDFTIATGQSAKLPANLFSRDGYAFKGWATEPEGLIRYEDEAEYTKSTYGNVELYAQWQPITYKITFNSHGGSEIADKEYTIESEYISLPNPTKTGYDFCGWFSDPDFSGYEKTGVDMGSYGDISLYAKWQVVDCYIEFQTNCELWIENKIYTIETPTFELPKLTRAGYVFSGWYASEDCSGEAVESIELGTYGNKKYYASWSNITYTVTFDVKGGEPEDNILFDCEDYITLPIPSKAGYTFAGWFTNQNLVDGAISAISQGTCEDIQVYAKWEILPYSITYVGEGEYTMPIGTKYGYNTESEIELKTPTKAGYEFLGWYDNEGLTGEAITAIPMGSVGDKTFYPKWEIIEYTVSFDSNGGSSVEDVKFNCQSDYIELTTPTKDGYTFVAWYKNSNLTGSTVSAIYPSSTFEDIVLYAKWNVIPYNITYVGYDYSLPSNTEYEYNIETATFQLKDPTRKGYEFLGWYNNEACEGEAIEEIVEGSFGNKTFYPKWEAIVYNIVFESNGGNTVDTITYTVEDSTIDLPQIYDMSKEHYTFAGWYKTSSLNSGDYIYSVSGSDCTDYTLYAKWTPIEYQITYDYRDNGEYSTKAYKPYNYESAFDLMTPVRDGYEFLGWYDNKNFTGEKIEKIVAGTHGAKTFYACWKEVPYTIQFNSNGGKEELVNKDYQITTPTFDLPRPTKDHYDFAGWYANESFGGDARHSISVGTFGNMTLYAKWTPKNYTIIYHTNGGEYIDVGSYNIETTTFRLPTPVRNGYEFLGWYENDDFSGTKTEYIYTGSHGNKVYHAKWSEPIEYTVTFVLNSGIFVPDSGTVEPVDNKITFTVLDSIVLPEVTRDNHIFDGWYENSDFTGSKMTSIEVGTFRDITVHAKLEPEEYHIVYNLVGGIFDNNASAPSSYKKGTADLNISTPIYTANMTNTAYAKYNLFMGWFEDAAYTVAFDPKNNDLATNPRDLYLYAKWDIVKVYTGWDLLPNEFVVNENDTASLNQRFLIDLSVCTAGGIYSDKEITLTNCKEIILIGNPDVVYNNIVLRAQEYDSLTGLVITFENFNMMGNILCDSSAVDLTLNCVGTSKIEGVIAESATISGFADMTVIGDGALSIYGLDGIDGRSVGENGTDGECAIEADNFTVNMTGILNVYGGNGGNGVDGVDGVDGEDGKDVGWTDGTGNTQVGKDGTNGTNGGNGGQGGPSIITNNVNIILGSVMFQGGNGGSGGKGGAGGRGGKGGTNDWWYTYGGGRPGSGGDGGDGGDGGIAGNQVLMSADYITVAEDATLIVYCGDYGIAGAAGDGGLKGPPSGDPQGTGSGGENGISGEPGIVLGNPTTTPESRAF